LEVGFGDGSFEIFDLGEDVGWPVEALLDHLPGPSDLVFERGDLLEACVGDQVALRIYIR
jgi:hypothetical protein